MRMQVLKGSQGSSTSCLVLAKAQGCGSTWMLAALGSWAVAAIHSQPLCVVGQERPSTRLMPCTSRLAQGWCSDRHAMQAACCSLAPVAAALPPAFSIAAFSPPKICPFCPAAPCSQACCPARPLRSLIAVLLSLLPNMRRVAMLTVLSRHAVLSTAAGSRHDAGAAPGSRMPFGADCP